MRYKAIVYAIKWLAERGVKTAAYMSRVIDTLVRDLYNGVIESDEFNTELADLIENQFRRAFNEGMRNNGLDPAKDMTDEWEAEYQRMVTAQYEFIERFAKDILEGSEKGQSKDEFMARADLWANQYESVVNEAQLITADKKQKYKWTLGATEEHCSTCSRLNGIIAYAEEWEQAGFHPQRPPNELLECGGWRCDCSLEPTDKRRTADALGILLDIAASGNV
jgi:hypothetical protein